MSDTPRTDKALAPFNTMEDEWKELTELAPQLERELTEARAEIERLRGEVEKALFEGYWAGRAGKHIQSSWNDSRAKHVMESKK